VTTLWTPRSGTLPSHAMARGSGASGSAPS
jgi:hypothetical protein